MISQRIVPRILVQTARPFSSLRSSRSTGPRGRRSEQHGPAGIPNNATLSSQKLVGRISEKKTEYEREMEKDNRTLSGTGSQNSLLTPVFVPEDPGAVIKERHPAARLLENSGLVVQRNLELGSILLGYEQANKYVIMDPAGNTVGFIAEEENLFTRMLVRQLVRTHRSFTTHVFNKYGIEVLRFYRPFAFINSRITAYDPIDPTSYTGTPTRLPEHEQRIVGQCAQQWHPWRRKYDLFLYKNDIGEPSTAEEAAATGERGQYDQFAYVDEPFLAWDFTLLSEDDPPRVIGSVNRNFAGFGREIFTDTGVYALRMDSASTALEPPHLVSNTADGKRYRSPGLENKAEIQGVGEIAGGRGMTLDERVVMMSAAVSIDFDYFSRHSGHGGIMPFGVFGGGADSYSDS